ncbi:hypothetical protein H6G33_09550 [Calothrix sp. FACHB-1219]|uniref:hypothetical protein n=1 Tax=unclassified Calothrix TaxID=2619626 RepID=UPI001688CAFA|nr:MULTISPECIES: hypothetical protein [unclassified Calothrix]MBD2201591.1 hypothetical protein [Calothrix sp. FACHB-168]MBD2217277.1 hypothetical protein [Calothrix sp. FACHB-1219]
MYLKSLEERLVWLYLIGTYIWYFIGASYLFSSVLGWSLAIVALWKWYRGKISIPKGVWLWLVAFFLLEIFTLIGSINTGYRGINLIRNLAGEFFSNGLLAAFPLVGCLSIRPQVIYRAVCWLVIQSIVMIPFFIAMIYIRIPSYISPLVFFDKIIKSGPNSYKITFFNPLEPNRLSLFCPWAPALGFVGAQFFYICREESNRILKYLGMIGSSIMLFISVSRLGQIVLPLSLLITTLVSYVNTSSRAVIATGLGSLFVTFLSDIKEIVIDTKDNLTSARASSSLVRERLQELVKDKMWNELWFGHGSTEPGSRIVANMPLGTHHTWFGYLFVNGICGAMTIAIAYIVSLVNFALDINKGKVNRVCFSFLLVMGLYSIGETWKSLAYLLMPGLILVGIGFRDDS